MRPPEERHGRIAAHSERGLQDRGRSRSFPAGHVRDAARQPTGRAEVPRAHLRLPVAEPARARAHHLRQRVPPRRAVETRGNREQPARERAHDLLRDTRRGAGRGQLTRDRAAVVRREIGQIGALPRGGGDQRVALLNRHREELGATKRHPRAGREEPLESGRGQPARERREHLPQALVVLGAIAPGPAEHGRAQHLSDRIVAVPTPPRVVGQPCSDRAGERSRLGAGHPPVASEPLDDRRVLRRGGRRDEEQEASDQHVPGHDVPLYASPPCSSLASTHRLAEAAPGALGGRGEEARRPSGGHSSKPTARVHLDPSNPLF